MIDLRPFCANKWEVRTGLHKPWRDGAWVYATNGHLCVRVPAESIQDAPLRDSETQPKNPPSMFSQFLDGMEGEFLLMPPLLPDVECVQCGSTGEIDDDECPICYGTEHAFTYFELGDAGYNLHYLHLLAELPEVRIRTQGTKTAAALIFDGGQALLMPMRKK